MKNKLLIKRFSWIKNLLTENRYVLLLLGIMIASFWYYVPKYGLIYDGGLYASLGYSLQEHGRYLFNGLPGDVPPIYSVFLAISIFFVGERGIFFVTPVFSAVLVISLFYIFKREFDEDLAFLGALLILFNPPIFFYAIQVVRDPPLMAFVILSYFIYFKKSDDTKTRVLLGFMMGLAFLTKYAAIIYLVPIFFHALYSRKPLKTTFLAAIALVFPWMVWSYITHGTLLVSHSSYLTGDLGANVVRFFTFILPLLIEWSSPILILPAIPGFFEKLKDDRLNPFVLLMVLTILIGVFWPEKDIRYVFLVFPLVVYFALIFLVRFKKIHVMLFLIIALSFQANTTFHLVEGNVYTNVLFEDAGHWLRENTPEDAGILTHSHRQVNYFSHRLTLQPPKNPDNIEKFIDRYNLTYAVVDTYEKYTPKYMYTYLERYRLLKTFKREGDEIRIYNLSTPTTITVLITFDFENPEGAKNIDGILKILNEHGVKSTFFVTGVMARDFPEIIGEIKSRGHEIGSHGYNHEFPIFKEEDAELFAELFNKTFEYEWSRSVKSEQNFEEMLNQSREEIKNAVGSYPLAYRSPILTPSYTKDMRYLDVVKRAGFTIDSSISRRYMDEGLIEHSDIEIVPASLSDSELEDQEWVMEQARMHSEEGLPFVIFFHPWRFSEEGHFESFENILKESESRFGVVEYLSIEGYIEQN